MKKPFMTSRFGISRTARALLLAVFALTAGKAMAIGKVGEMAGEWAGLKDLDGNTHNLADYKGKVLLILTVQWNCGGCNANAPRVGQIAKKFEGPNFQAIGPDINFGTVPNLRTFEKNLKKIATDVKIPLLTGLKAPSIVSTNLGTKWTEYDALRDVFFIVDHTGKIVERVDGNRGGATTEENYKKIEGAIAAAIAKVPTTTIAISGNDLCLRACKRGDQFQIDMDPRRTNLSGDVTLRILDPQGRVIRNLDWNASKSAATATPGGRQAIWDGLDSRGRAVAWGTYFLNAASPAASVTLLLSWVP
jgi:peroxiredoxin